MNIWHICSIGNDLANGMVNVIPMHIKEQSKFEKVTLVNLNSYKYEMPNVTSFNDDDVRRLKHSGIIRTVGEPDLVIFHGVYNPKIWVFYIVFIKNKYKYIVVPHGSLSSYVQNKNKIKKGIAHLIIVRTYIKNASLIHYLSIREQENSKKYNGTSIVVPNGICKKEKIAQRKSSGYKKLVYVGRIDFEAKGVDILLQACKNIRKFMIENNIQVHIYGPIRGKNVGDFNQLIKDGKMEDVVCYFGPVYGDDKERVLLDADFFIQTSRTEGMPMGILEAMSYGIPLLITEGTSMGDVVNKYECGCVSDTTVEGVERLIKGCLECDSQVMSDAALKCVENYYWDQVTKNTLNEYRKVCNDYYTKM